jgi:hypothetical protein
MQSSSVGLIPGSSATAFSAVLGTKSLSYPSDEVVITQELLNKGYPRINSFTNSIPEQAPKSLNKPRSPEPLGASHEKSRWRAAHTSNTWTSSSGDMLSDRDELDDRTIFIQEYNRLARKV